MQKKLSKNPKTNFVGRHKTTSLHSSFGQHFHRKIRGLTEARGGVLFAPAFTVSCTLINYTATKKDLYGVVTSHISEPRNSEPVEGLVHVNMRKELDNQVPSHVVPLPPLVRTISK